MTSSSCGMWSVGSAQRARAASRKSRHAYFSCLGASSRETIRQTSCSASVYSIRGSGCPGFQASACGGDVVAPLAVRRIARARVVLGELDVGRPVVVGRDRRVQLGFLEHVVRIARSACERNQEGIECP